MISADAGGMEGDGVMEIGAGATGDGVVVTGTVPAQGTIGDHAGAMVTARVGARHHGAIVATTDGVTRLTMVVIGTLMDGVAEMEGLDATVTLAVPATNLILADRLNHGSLLLEPCVRE